MYKGMCTVRCVRYMSVSIYFGRAIKTTMALNLCPPSPLDRQRYQQKLVIITSLISVT